ncbi:hypothetical protein ccbrp13_10590 [Ktedonobacteria bacterium brp13]|nr:hypothetical protein ccbrp13_10590 [Ktedonobacteria bacterium brp13]
MEKITKQLGNAASRRSFLRKGLAVGGAGAIGVGLLANGLPAFAHEGNGRLTKGDAAILRFLAALETLESDLWLQYNELGGIHPDPENEFPQGSGNPAYTAALVKLDSDMPQYIHDNTDDEFSHFEFINAYLVSKGAEPVDLEKFRTLKGSQATGADKNTLRLTNLMQLAVDTSYWTRYRSDSKNPDLDPEFEFPQAVQGLDTGQHPAIPRTDADTTDANQIQAIANTAAFHFGFIEQGGTSLYPALAQRVHNVEVLRILLSIGPSETMHFQVWHDKAGNAVSPPLAPLTFGTLTFRDLTSAGPDFQPNLIMPEPTFFLSRTFPKVSIIRPTETKGAAKGAVTALTNDGLFIGQSKDFFKFLNNLADEADEARR